MQKIPALVLREFGLVGGQCWWVERSSQLFRDSQQGRPCCSSPPPGWATLLQARGDQGVKTHLPQYIITKLGLDRG